MRGQHVVVTGLVPPVHNGPSHWCQSAQDLEFVEKLEVKLIFLLSTLYQAATTVFHRQFQKFLDPSTKVTWNNQVVTELNIWR